MLILTVIQGPDKGKKFELPANEPQLIGRSSEALPISDTTVSCRHAELTPDDGSWYLNDLQSQNGTYVNGERIKDRIRLRPGDQLRTGATLFVFGVADEQDEIELIRPMRPDQMESSVEHVISSNDDSVVLAEPEPRAAAIHHLQVIYRLTALTTTLTEREELLKAVMELVFNEFKPERGFIVLLDERDGKARPVVIKHRAPPKNNKEARIHFSQTIMAAALKNREGVLSTNAMSDTRFAKGDSVQRFHIRSAICSPIEFGERQLGAIYIDSSVANYTFTPGQLALLNAIARHAGLALANAEAYAKKLHTERLAAIGETVAILSHSIKNILQGLRGGADVVEMGLKKEDLKVARGGWGILRRNIDRIMGLTLNMLAYSRNRTLEFELTRIGPLLEDCATLLQGQCDARQVALILDVDSEMPPVMMDPHLMHQALVNLIGNAVEAVDPGTGAVTVQASYVAHPPPPTPGPIVLTGAVGGVGGAGKPELRIAVIDNGPGIAPERHAQIFEPFNTTKGIRGTGLGLAVTKRIVEEHGGRIALESAPGRGATFVVHLPADAGRAGSDPSATAAGGAGDVAKGIG